MGGLSSVFKLKWKQFYNVVIRLNEMQLYLHLYILYLFVGGFHKLAEVIFFCFQTLPIQDNLMQWKHTDLKLRETDLGTCLARTGRTSSSSQSYTRTAWGEDTVANIHGSQSSLFVPFFLYYLLSILCFSKFILLVA